MTTELLECLEVETAPNPTASVIWMHGLGADGSDFVPIVRELELESCGPIRFVFPHAPMMPVSINYGRVMRAWYDILGTDFDGAEDDTTLRTSQQRVEHLIAREIERGIPAERIILAGFSQGCAMTLQTGLRYPHRLAGLLGLSGYLPLADKIESERHPANQDTPIFQAHGNSDQVIDLARAEESRDLLQSLGYQVEWHEYAMQHSVCLEELQDISAWFKRVLG